MFRSKNVLIVIFNYLLLHCCYALVQPEDLLAKSLNRLVSQILLEMPKCVVVIISGSIDLEAPKEFLQMRFSPDSDELQSFIKATYELKCSGYLIDQEIAGNFFIFLKEARLNANVRLIPKIIVIPNKVGEYAADVFKINETAFIPDMIIIQTDNSTSEERLFVITNDFQGRTRSLKGEIIGIWPEDDMVFFPDKIADLKGKELIVSSLHYPPYVLADGGPLDGVEVRPQIEFCRLHNCSLRLKTSEYMWGNIWPNGTANGIFGEIYTDQSDFGVAGNYLWLEEYSYLDYSTPYGVGHINCLVPKPTRADEWKTVFLPFSSAIWSLLIVSILTATVIMHIVNIASGKISDELILGGEFRTFTGILFRAIGMSLLQPPPRILGSSPFRRFFTIFEVLFLLYTTIYAGAIASVLTIPKYNPAIDTPTEFYESGLRWAGLHVVWVKSLIKATDPQTMALVNRFETHDSKTLIRLANEGHYGIATELMETGQMIEADYLSVEILAKHHVMKEDLSQSPVIMLHRKGSPYLEEMNRIIGNCRAAGLFLLWTTNITANHLSSRFQIAMQESKGSGKVAIDEPIKLKLLHIEGAFMLLAAGFLISLLIFFIEIMKFKLFDSKYKKSK